ncbi:MAG: IclR family transcriptional regulator [Rhodospirillaceae bacterium]|jgi:IclR family transcriptional regulator, KDG regulon repressor|nr:IclR family transcriptional regulator [Rhodospirillaceae bacterium]
MANLTKKGILPKQRSGNAYAVEAVNRAADILFVFSHADSELSLPEIVSRSGLPKTTTFRVLSTLCDRGLCMQDSISGKYSLGFELLHLADIRRRQANIHGLAMPLLRVIRDQVEETVVLSIRTGDYRVHIDFAEGLHPMRRMVELGRSSPLYAGAASKVLFAGLSDLEIDDYLNRTLLEKICNQTITETDALKQEIARIREQGFAESRSELFTGGASLAAPVKDYTGATVAVIDIITPEGRFTKEHRDLCMSSLLNGVGDLSQQLGFRARDIAS